MRIFALDSSGRTSSAAIVDGGQLLSESFLNVGLTHSETLLSVCDRVFKDAGLLPADIDYFAVTCGPGSFTGLRIGISTIKGLAFLNNTRCVQVPTLEALARGVYIRDTVIVPVLDARGGRYYCAVFEISENGEHLRLLDDEIITLEKLKEKLIPYNRSIVFVGDASEDCRKYFGNNAGILELPLSAVYIRGASVASAAMEYIKNDNFIYSKDLVPVYMQASQAEREKLKAEENNDCTCK